MKPQAVAQGKGNRPLRILFAAAECHPFEKSSGIADVTSGLPRELAALGHEVEIFIPLYLKALLYPVLHDLPIYRARDFPPVKVRLGPYLYRSRIYSTRLPDSTVKVHLVDADTFQYFTAKSALASHRSLEDTFSRFAFFSKVIATIAARRRERPDVVHAHDWPAGLVPLLLTTQFYWTGIASVFTVHNVRQSEGVSPEVFYRLTRQRESRHPGLYGWAGRGLLHEGRMDLLKAGLVRADVVTTVSPSHAEELQREEYGGSYAPTLRWIAAQGGLRGILNGLDPSWLPARSPAELLADRPTNKAELQRLFDLPVDPTALLAIMTSRLTASKGYPLLPEALGRLRREGYNIQLGIASEGENGLLEHLLDQDSPQLPVRHRPWGDEPWHRLLYSGADLLLMPSHEEPCGLGQLAAQAYGTPPLVHATGGLRDTVGDEETGFVFHRYHAWDFADAIARAHRLFREEPDAWRALQERIMGLDRSWRASAQEYVELYRLAQRRAARADRYAPLPPTPVE